MILPFLAGGLLDKDLGIGSTLGGKRLGGSQSKFRQAIVAWKRQNAQPMLKLLFRTL